MGIESMNRKMTSLQHRRCWLSCGEDDKAASRNSIAVIEKGASRAPPHIPLLELWLNLERKAGDEHKARAVEDRLKKLLSEQRYAPVGHEVN